MLEKEVATPYEIQFSYSQTDVAEKVKAWFSKENLTKSLSNMADRLYRHFDNIKVTAIVWSNLREYFLLEYFEFAEIIEDCFPGLSLPQVWEGEIKRLVGNHLPPKYETIDLDAIEEGKDKWVSACQHLLHNEFRVSTICRKRGAEEDEIEHLLQTMSIESEDTKWDVYYPKDIRDPMNTLKRIIIHADGSDADSFDMKQLVH